MTCVQYTGSNQALTILSARHASSTQRSLQNYTFRYINVLEKQEESRMEALKKLPFWAGALCGAVGFTILGFGQLGWTLGNTAEKMTQEAVVVALVPICVDQRRRASATDRDAFEAIKTWERGDFVKNIGWATMPGSDSVAPGVAYLCAEALLQ